jgi:uncharacterized membrane protein
MPQIPIIIPLIVVGLVVGSIVKSRSPRISKKKLAWASLVAGLLNSIYAYLTYSLVPTQIPTGAQSVLQGRSPSPTGLASTSVVSFVAASFLAAFIMVLLVLGVAIAYARIRKGEESREAAETTSEEEAALTSS